MEDGSNQEGKFKTLSILEFTFETVKESNDCIFFTFKSENKSILFKNFVKWRIKYPDFGAIISNAGILIDCSQVDFDLRLKSDLLTDIYYQFINNGLGTIKDECINYHL